VAVGETLLTAEEYWLVPDNGQPTELIRGRIVAMNMPAPRHGEICAKIVRILGTYLDAHDIGRPVCNDSGVITERDPDTVRGGDVAFYSYSQVPRGPLPDGYSSIPPELLFEVRSPGDRWRQVFAKVLEYLNAGVITVVVLDPGLQAAFVYHADLPNQVLNTEDELILPQILPGFRVPVSRFFD